MKDLFEASNRASGLALQEAGRSRNSYLGMAAVALVSATVAAFLLDTVYSGTNATRVTSLTFLADIIFFFGFTVLARSGAWVSRNRTNFTSDEHLAFLRRLPLTVRELVAGRMLTVVFSVLIVSTPFLFVPYLWSEGFRSQLGVSNYLLFAAFWIGYALFLESVGLFTELGLGGWAGFTIYLVLGFLLGGFVGYTAAEGLSLIWEVVNLIRSHGPLLGVSVLSFGILTLALSGWFTARRLEKRELAS